MEIHTLVSDQDLVVMVVVGSSCTIATIRSRVLLCYFIIVIIDLWYKSRPFWFLRAILTVPNTTLDSLGEIK